MDSHRCKTLCITAGPTKHGATSISWAIIPMPFSAPRAFEDKYEDSFAYFEPCAPATLR
jgi:hypothetical protein